MAMDLIEGESVFLDGTREATVVAIEGGRAQIQTEDDHELHWVGPEDLTLEPR